MYARTRWLAAVALAIIFAPTAPLRAQNIFEKMVMPGKLIEGHAKLEKDCNNCHKPFSKKKQTQLCLDCHKKISADVTANVGLHGRRPDVAKTECKHCHTDHIGRDADIVRLDRETFNHSFTDFALKGKHTSVSCDKCHKPKVKFREAPSACVKCHKNDQPHKGRLGEKCESCHREDGWKTTKPFNHDKTKFPLHGKHKEVSCKACHSAERYKDIPTACVGCHRLQDIHKGARGEKCEKCHSPEKWKTVRFDHDKDTKFPLRGKHKKTKCDRCHIGNFFEQKLSMECSWCHRNDDPHKGELGKLCGQCHTEDGWRRDVSFDHDITRFPLIGQHAVVPCEECHLTQAFKDAPLLCAACHGKADYHKGRLGDQCAICHNPNGWKLWRFNHDTQTKFPLTGSHAGLDCHACHVKKVVKKIALPKNCFACHQADDAHRGAFGRLCERCHTTDKFSRVRLSR